MKYSYVLRTPHRVLRPVTEGDAEFIVKLRNQPHVKGRINDTSLDVERQRLWIREYLKRDNEYYWIIETPDGRPIGTSSLYHYDAEKKQIETGRWVMLSDAPETNIMASRVQMRDFVFKNLCLKRIVFDVVSTNKQVLKYHRLCGAVETHTEKEALIIQGEKVDLVWFEETPASWGKIRSTVCRWAGIPTDKPYGTIEKVLV